MVRRASVGVLISEQARALDSVTALNPKSYSEIPHSLSLAIAQSGVMLPPSASDMQTGVLELGPKPNCEQRNKLAEALVELSIKLSIAASQMAEFATADVAAFENTKAEMAQLRDEWDNIRAEFYRHRAQHGC